jgi:hypothetical protein
LFSRGVPLAPYGSIEDRVMREMVFRERQERVAHLDAVGKMISRVFNVDADKAFGAIVSEYASEVFQETYDADLLRRKVAVRRAAQARVRAKKQRDIDLIKRLERMGEWADQNWEQQKPKEHK